MVYPHPTLSLGEGEGFFSPIQSFACVLQFYEDNVSRAPSFQLALE